MRNWIKRFRVRSLFLLPGSLAVALSLAVSVAVSSCSEPEIQTAPSIYHWKSSFTFQNKDYQKLDSLGVKRVYIRFFDMDLVDGEVRPKAGLVWRSVPDTTYDWVPCVYITQKAIQAIGTGQADEFARKCLYKIQKIADAASLPYWEIQLDCDWSATTREAFFAFCSAIKNQVGTNTQLSSTIRLHQYRDQELMGVPPVDRGMLMFYNNGAFRSEAETNSILNLKKAAYFLTRTDEYPLELDLALPLFSWAVHFRNGQFQALKSNWDRSMLDTSKLLLPVEDGNYLCKERGLFLDEFLLERDRIRMEESSVRLNLEALQLLQDHDFPQPKNLSLYHYNPRELEAESCQRISQIYGAWDRP